jgi:alkylhydroperoxidase family enzyme
MPNNSKVQEDTMTTLRVSKAEVPSELRESMIKQFGAVAEPVEVTWHNPSVAQAALEFGAKIAAWDAADESLKTFAHMAVAAQVGCSWCLDINYFQARNQILEWSRQARCRAGENRTCSRHWSGRCSSTPRP